MNFKKIISLMFLFIFFSILPTFAAKKVKTEETNVISNINMNWWSEFDDEYLTQYLTKALQYNNDLKIATLKIEEATQNKNIQRSKEMPSLGVGAVPALYKLPSVTSSDGLIALPIYSSYELDLFGKNRTKTKSFDKLIEISKQNERSSYISVISAVGTTYFNIVQIDKLIELQNALIKDRQNIYNLMKMSNEQGLISTADTVRANKSLIQSEADLMELKKTQERLLNMLAVLTGDSPENSQNFQRKSYNDLVLNKKIPNYIKSEIIETRPDYISSELMLQKTGLDVSAAKKEFLPGFNIFGLISFNSTEFYNKMNWTNSLGILGGGATLPLFTGGMKIANLKLQKNKYKQAIENYQKTNLTAIQEVNDSLSDLKLDNEKYLKTLESFNAEKTDYHYTNLKYNEGILSKLDLIQKHESVLNTEKLVVKEKTACFINQISLYKTTAGADLTK
jgi:NodT family efflux transporter outer membrane factor (OMF) lipoprotein